MVGNVWPSSSRFRCCTCKGTRGRSVNDVDGHVRPASHVGHRDPPQPRGVHPVFGHQVEHHVERDDAFHPCEGAENGSNSTLRPETTGSVTPIAPRFSSRNQLSEMEVSSQSQGQTREMDYSTSNAAQRQATHHSARCPGGMQGVWKAVSHVIPLSEPRCSSRPGSTARAAADRCRGPWIEPRRLRGACLSAHWESPRRKPTAIGRNGGSDRSPRRHAETPRQRPDHGCARLTRSANGIQRHQHLRRGERAVMTDQVRLQRLGAGPDHRTVGVGHDHDVADPRRHP